MENLIVMHELEGLSEKELLIFHLLWKVVARRRGNRLLLIKLMGVDSLKLLSANISSLIESARPRPEGMGKGVLGRDGLHLPTPI